MKNYQTSGTVIGSLIGCVFAGILSYLHVSIVIICLFLLGSLFTGYYIGSKFKKSESI